MKRAKDQFKTEIEVKNLHPKFSVSLAQTKRFIRQVLKKEKIKACSLTLLIVGDSHIRALNKKYLRKDLPTDVLSFDLKYPGASRKSMVGDIVVSVDAAARVSRELSLDFKQEVLRYIVHGILHLTGYDDTAPAEKKKMWKRQEELLAKGRSK